MASRDAPPTTKKATGFIMSVVECIDHEHSRMTEAAASGASPTSKAGRTVPVSRSSTFRALRDFRGSSHSRFVFFALFVVKILLLLQTCCPRLGINGALPEGMASAILFCSHASNRSSAFRMSGDAHPYLKQTFPNAGRANRPGEPLFPLLFFKNPLGYIRMITVSSDCIHWKRRDSQIPWMVRNFR